MRRKKYEEPENKERWLVSYADLMTLLFAFFVVMYAISSVNEKKFKHLSQSIAIALAGEPKVNPIELKNKPPTIIAPIDKPSKAHNDNTETLIRERKKMKHLAKNIMDVLAPLVRDGKVRVTQTPKGVVVEINASVLFGPGDAALSSSSMQALRAVGNVLKTDDHKIIVEGHTDNTPISNLLFASNWELSAARASRVVRLFSEEGVAESRMVASGRADTVPVAENSGASERARNRRVSILILSEEQGGLEVPLD